MKMLVRAALLLSAAIMASPALAGHAARSDAPAGFAPEMVPVTVPAVSVPLEGNVTSSSATPTSGGASISGGVATIGPLAPQLGRNIRIILRGTWAGTVQVGTSASDCSTFNPLTVAGQPWGNYSSNANEAVDQPSLDGIVYCLQATVTSGTLSYSLRQ